MSLRIQFILALLLITITSLQAQNFEGWITYKVEIRNPYPDQIPEEQFQEMVKQQIGERGYLVQKIFYKGNRYYSELDAGPQSGFQLYRPEDGLLYSWQAQSDTVTTVNTKKATDAVKQTVSSDETGIVLGIDCKVVILKTTLGESKVWYNSNQLRMDPSLYEGHIYGYWGPLLKVSKSIPLKMEMQGMAGPITLTAMEYKTESVPDSKFELPQFKVTVANPLN